MSWCISNGPGRREGRGEDSRPATVTVVVPPRHFGDWLDRFCHVDSVEWEPAGKRVRATLSERDRDDLLSDARHYAETRDYDPGLRSSARATVRALAR